MAGWLEAHAGDYRQRLSSPRILKWGKDLRLRAKRACRKGAQMAPWRLDG